MTNEEIIQKIENIQIELLDLHNVVKTFKVQMLDNQPQAPQENLEPKYDVPEYNSTYWYVNKFNSASKLNWSNCEEDFARLRTNNIFYTQQDCQKEAIYKRLRAKYVAYVKEYNNGLVADWWNNQDGHYYLEWNNNKKGFDVMNSCNSISTDLDFYFNNLHGLLPFIQKRITDAEIRAVVNHDLSCIEVGGE